MSRRNRDPEQMRHGEEFQAYAERNGCVRRNGRHPYFTAPNGKGCPIPNGELPIGTRRSILRMFAHMGITRVALMLIPLAALLALALLSV